MPNEKHKSLEEKIMKGFTKKSLDGLDKLKPTKPQGDKDQSQQNKGNTQKTGNS